MPRKTKPKEASPVVRLLDLVWRETSGATGRSWERLNHAMREALSLAVKAGFAFAEGDMRLALAGGYSAEYWAGSCTEWLYTLAVAVGNGSACKSYEAYTGRQPLYADGVTVPYSGGFVHTYNPTRQRERLCVGATFDWKGHRVEVTSFGGGSDGGDGKDMTSVVACSRPPPGDKGPHVNRRFRIPREAIVADRAERKERAAALSELTEAGEVLGNSKVMKLLGVKKREDFDRLPIGAVREGLAKVQVLLRKAERGGR